MTKTLSLQRESKYALDAASNFAQDGEEMS